MLTGIIIGFVAGQIVGIVAAAFLATAREPQPVWAPQAAPQEAPAPRRSRGLRILISRRGLARRISGRVRAMA